MINAPVGILNMKARILVRKLGFLLRLVSANGHVLGARTFQSMSNDMESLCLVRECRELEETFQTHYTDKILGCGDQVNVRDIKKEVHKIDKRIVLEKCGTSDHSPAAVTIEERIGWIPLWEMALGCGELYMHLPFPLWGYSMNFEL